MRLAPAATTAAAMLLALAASSRLTAPPQPIRAAEAPVTWSQQVAPILYKNCTTCHHPGGAGPFSLLTYQDARRWSTQIVAVTGSRFMPPWLPDPGFGDFADSRRLKDSDLLTLKQWLAAGMPQGDMSAAPATPVYSSGWQLGTPDLILTAAGPVVVPAGGTDIFQNVILPYPLPKSHYIRAMEILPGEARVVHHANVLIDRPASLRAKHANDWKSGIPGMEITVDSGDSFDPDSHFLFWKPDSPVLEEPEGMAWRLDPGNDLILNMHLKPSGKAESLTPRIGLYFTDTPPQQLPLLLQLEHDRAIDIPPGDSHFAVEDQLTIPVAIDVLGIYPHAHYLGKELEAFAVLPNGEKKWLIRISDWDIDRQSVYRYRDPVRLPAGTVLHMHYVYDNSAGNVRNPSTPSVRVRAGNRSTDEMGHLWLEVLPVEKTGKQDPRLPLYQAWMEHRLSHDPQDSTALYNLAAVADMHGEPTESMALYQRALQVAPDDSRLWTAYGAASLAAGQRPKAREAFQKALAIDPANTNARFDLATLDLQEERYSQAEAGFRDLISRNNEDAAAHSGLGAALFVEGNTAAAEPELQKAIALDSHDATALDTLGQVAIEQKDPPRAIDRFQAALRERDDAATREHLALAYMQSGKPAQAIEQMKQAINLAPKDATAHATLSQLLDSQNDYAGAIREQRAALELAPNDPDGWSNLGVMEARAGETAQARKDFEQALQLSPNHAAAKANLARLDRSRE